MRMSDFTVSDLLYVKKTIGGQRHGYNKSCKREYKISRIYYSGTTGKMMAAKVFDEHGYSDNMSTKHCDLVEVEICFVFKCPDCGKYNPTCKHGVICKCNPDCIHNECIQCVLFDGVESDIMMDHLAYGDYYGSSDYRKMTRAITKDAIKSSKTYKYGVKPLYNCLYDDILNLHRDIYKRVLDDICFNTFCLVNHTRCGQDSPMNGVYYDLQHIIKSYVYE